MRFSRFKQRRQVTPFLWGWAVFTFDDFIPTHVYGVMQAAGVQFDPYRYSVADSPFGAVGLVGRRPYINFASFETSSTASSLNTSISTVATNVIGGFSDYGNSTIVANTNTTVFGKKTKNRVRIDSIFSGVVPLTIDVLSAECAVARL